MNEETKPDMKQPLQVVPVPALVWRCPWDGCHKESAVPGMRAVGAFFAGKRIGVQCQACNNPVVLTQPEAHRIAVPNMAPGLQPTKTMPQHMRPRRVDRKR